VVAGFNFVEVFLRGYEFGNLPLASSVMEIVKAPIAGVLGSRESRFEKG
jgi:hypothetical protein